MNVHSLEIVEGPNPRCFAPLPLQISLDVEVQASRYTVPMTQDWSGLVVVINGKTLLRHLVVNGQSIPVDLELEFEASMFDLNATGPFANLGVLLTAKDEGVTNVGLSVLKPEALAEGNISAEESASTGSFRIFPVNLTLTESQGDAISLDVGSNVVPRRGAVTTGGQTQFDPHLAFAGEFSLRDLSEQACTLGPLRQPLNETQVRPMQMNYTWPGPLGSASPARFEVPRIIRLTNEGAVQFGDDMFKIVHARRPGSLNLTTTITATDSRYDVPLGLNAFDVYQVNPVPLSIELAPAPADNRNGKLLFEDRWIPLPDQPNGGRLVSSFRLEVKRGAETLYRSWEPAILEMTLTPSAVLINALYVDDDRGVRTQLPFRLWLTTSAQEIVEFWQLSEDAGKPQVHRTLDDIMAAIGYGQPCTIEVSILNFDEPIPLNVDVYRIPASETLTVEIPPPLEADLMLWEDDHFTGVNALSLGPGAEVIYATGRISGQVRNRTGAESERITLELTFPAANAEELTLVFGSGATQRQNFASEVDGLRLGANQFRLTAEKPINLALFGGPSTDVATLTGVRPQSVTFTASEGQMTGATVVRRDLGRFTYGYARAARAKLQEICSSGSYDVATYAEAYEANSGNQDVTLRRETGNHTLRLIAENDFGSVSSSDFSVNAPAPDLTPTFLTSNVPHDPADLSHVGNSVSRVDLRIRARFCLTYEVAHQGVAYRSIQPSDPLQQSETTHSAPAPRNLDIGTNVFNFSFSNEFATGTRSREVRRRDDVFDVAGTLAVTFYDTRQEAVMELVEIRPANFEGLIPGETGGFIVQFSHPDLASPIGFDLIRWRVHDRDTQNDTDPETLDYRLTFNAESIGPDFEHLASFMEIDPADLAENDPDTIAFPIGVLSDVSGLELSGPNRYWTRARIWGHSGELWIPLLTRAVGP